MFRTLFANARDVKNLFEKASEESNVRMFAEGIGGDKLNILTPDDFHIAMLKLKLMN